MSATQLRAIAIAVAALLLLWGATEMWSRRPDTAGGAFAFTAPASGDVDTIAITRAGDTALIVRHGAAAWTVNGFPAAATAINEFLGALRDSVRPPPELAAESPASFARMGVDSADGRLLRLAGGGKTLARLFVGGQGPEFDASYVRLPGDAHVYLWRGRLPSLAARSVDDWRDHEIAAITPDSIAEVEIRRAGRSYVLRRQGDTWTLPGGLPADSVAVAQLLARLRTVTASGFATARQAESLRFDRAQRRLSVRGTDRRELLALAFDSSTSGYWVRRPGGGMVYRLDAWLVDQLTPQAGTFTKK